MPDRIVVITGAFGALGSAVAAAAAAGGDRLALVDFAGQAPPGLPRGEGVFLQGGVDLADPAAAEAAIEAAAARFGGLDVLVNVAGGFAWELVESGSAASWAGLHRMNVMTVFNTTRAALSHLKRSRAGRIVNVGAHAALKAGQGMGAYAAAKAGVHSLTQALAEELKPRGVTVNAVLPSILDTPANRADMPDADFSAWVSPDDLAAVILFLASPGAGAVTGALVPVTGRV